MVDCDLCQLFYSVLSTRAEFSVEIMNYPDPFHFVRITYQTLLALK